MPRKTRTALENRNRRQDARRGVSDAALRLVASQVAKLDDATVYALSEGAMDRATRDAADRDAHRRAEEYALRSAR